MSLRCLNVLALLLLLATMAPAQKQRDLKAGLKVVKCSPSATSNPNETMYELAVQVTNQGQSRLAFSNNNFVLVDAAGKRYVVNRGRYPQHLDLAPGETGTAERMFFSLPSGTKPVATQLILLRGAVGEAKL